MKIAIISHKTSNLINSRGELVKALVHRGHEVVAICNEDTSKEKVEQLGAKYRSATFDRTSISIFQNLQYLKKLQNILKEEKVDAVFMYTIKPIIFGSIAAKRNKVSKIYSLIAGMGYNYSVNSLKIRLIRIICDIGYKIALKYNTKVIFQNKEDMEELIQKHFIKKEQAELVDGTGVNMDIFTKEENRLGNTFNFLMVSRMLNVKGVKEYCKAAKILKEKYPNVRCIHIGEEDYTYRGLKKEFIEKYKEVVEFKGRVKNVPEYIKDCNAVVLPSYLREGIPRTLQEALAVGRPIITTNVRGCKETVKEGKNGYLITPKSVEELVKAMEKMLRKDELELKEMSEKSYHIALEKFDVNKINRKMIQIIEGEQK